MKKRNLKIRTIVAALLIGTSFIFTPSSSANAYSNNSYSKSYGSIYAELTENPLRTSGTINPTIHLTNTSDLDLDLNNLKLTYYYTADSEDEEIFNCLYAGTENNSAGKSFEYINLTSFVQGKIKKLEQPIKGGDTVLEITFTKGTIPSGQSIVICPTVHKINWANYDKSNDYSFINKDKLIENPTC